MLKDKQILAMNPNLHQLCMHKLKCRGQFSQKKKKLNVYIL